MMKGKSKQRWPIFAALFVTLHLLLAYGLPLWLYIMTAVGLGVLFFSQGPLAAASVTLSLIAATGIYALAIKIIGLDEAIYYRPHEKLKTYDYAVGHRVYKKNTKLVMMMPFGDLQSMTRENIAQPRRVEFITDSDGFRNNRDFHKQRYVLVGDSFVVGSDNTQNDILSVQLKHDYRLDTYNLGMPGDLSDYYNCIDGFRSKYGDNFEIVLFLYEGNDFPATLSSPASRKYDALHSYLDRYDRLFTGNSVYKVTRSLIARARKYTSIATSENVHITSIQGNRLAFYEPDIAISEQSDYRLPPNFESILKGIGGNLEHIFFIPTKYRVFYGALHPGKMLPHARWRELSRLCHRNGLKCTDLTALLVRQSERYLKNGDFIWWLDDTHWNRNGIAVAARAVARVIQ